MCPCLTTTCAQCGPLYGSPHSPQQTRSDAEAHCRSPSFSARRRALFLRPRILSVVILRTDDQPIQPPFSCLTRVHFYAGMSGWVAIAIRIRIDASSLLGRSAHGDLKDQPTNQFSVHINQSHLPLPRAGFPHRTSSSKSKLPRWPIRPHLNLAPAPASFYVLLLLRVLA